MKIRIKRTISILLCVVMLLGAAPLSGLKDIGSLFTTKASALAQNGQCGENVYWTFNEMSGLLTISGTGEMYEWDAISDRNNKSPFYENYGIKDVKIEHGVESIGSYAFTGCDGIKTVSLPNSLTSINENAFLFCYDIETIDIPNSVKQIKKGAFGSCMKLKTVKMSINVESIGESAFFECSKLTEISLSDGLVSIGKNAFLECVNIVSLTIPETVKSIGTDAFGYVKNIVYSEKWYNDVMNGKGSPWGADNVRGFFDGNFIYEDSTKQKIVGVIEKPTGNVTIPDGVTCIGYSAFFNCFEITGVTFPESLTCIDEFAFDGCIKLKDIKFPTNLKIIKKYAFFFCKALESISIPDSVTVIGDAAFKSCSKLTEIYIPDKKIDLGSSVFDDTGFYTDDANWENGALYISSSLVGAKLLESKDFEIKPGTKNLARRIFFWDYTMNNITIPNSVEFIGDEAFFDVNNIIYSEKWYNDVMKGVGSPWGAKAANAYVDVENGLYYYDASMELLLGCSANVAGSVVIPKSVEEVGENCFRGCDNITSITFNSPANFDETAISGCTNLKKLKADGNTLNGIVYTKPISDTGLVKNQGILFCNRDNEGVYSLDNENIKYICANAFANCTNLTVSIDEKVELDSIGENAFLNSGNYNKSWGNDVLNVGDYIVAANTNISKVIIDSDIEGIADKAFAGCKNLIEFNAAGSELRFLGNKTFVGCKNLKPDNFRLPNSILSVGSDIFDYEVDPNDESADTLQTVYAGTTLISAANDCTEFDFKEGTTCIAAGAFANCANLTSIEIPTSVKKIDKDTFRDCTSLKTVQLNESITEIGENAFRDCKSLAKINIPASVEKIGDLAFHGCTAIKQFTVANENEKYKTDNGVLMTADGKSIIQYPAAKDKTDSYTVGEGIYVSDLAFYGCKNIRNISIGDEVTFGNRNPFASCSAGYSIGGSEKDYLYRDNNGSILISVSGNVSGYVSLPDTVKEIGNYALSGRDKITSVSIPDGITKIGDNAFEKCAGLESINLPHTVKYIGDNAFEGCGNFSVTFDKTKLNPQSIIFGEGNDYLKSKITLSIISEINGVEVCDLLMNYKQTVKLNPEVSGKGDPSYEITYSSSNPKVVTVDEKGNVTAVDKGSAIITCTVVNSETQETFTDECTVTVKYTFWQYLIRIFLFGWLWY